MFLQILSDPDEESVECFGEPIEFIAGPTNREPLIQMRWTQPRRRGDDLSQRPSGAASQPISPLLRRQQSTEAGEQAPAAPEGATNE